jgi:hypothetical protein
MDIEAILTNMNAPTINDHNGHFVPHTQAKIENV